MDWVIGGKRSSSDLQVRRTQYMVDEHRSMSNELFVQRVPQAIGKLDTRRVAALLFSSFRASLMTIADCEHCGLLSSQSYICLTLSRAISHAAPDSVMRTANLMLPFDIDCD